MRKKISGTSRKVLLGIVFAVLIALGAATAAFTAGAAPFGAQATTTIVSTVTTGGSTVVTTVTTTTPDSTSSTSSTTGSTSTITTTTTTTTPRKITICHHARSKNGAVKHVTIRISRNAWKAHQRHGDSLGPCNTTSAKKLHSKPAHVKKFHAKHKKK